MSERARYDVVIIGAGMSGLAAGIRLAHFEKRVLILERHEAPGGLNSYYRKDRRWYDVGLHAVTNYVPPGTRGHPLTKLYRQLRIKPEDFGLCEQQGSRICFPGFELGFTNDVSVLESEIERVFPDQCDGWARLRRDLEQINETSLDQEAGSARQWLAERLSSASLIDALLLPLMYYGSARENDMDLGQFVIMFKALYLEGFARPFEGVQRILKALIKRYHALGGERRMRCGVRQLHTDGQRVVGLELDDGSQIEAEHVLSSAGLVETLALCEPASEAEAPAEVGKLGYVETISVLDCEPASLGVQDTIVFFSDRDRFRYACPEEAVDPASGVICSPNNYAYGEGRQLEEGLFRVTALANFERWKELGQEAYREAKEAWYARLQEGACAWFEGLEAATLEAHTIARDMFTPLTVERFTGHRGGAIYGSPTKRRDGRTALENLYLCGTDQGFLGIVGAMLSGISMANLHIIGKDR